VKKIPALANPSSSCPGATSLVPGSILESPALPAIVADVFGRLNIGLRARMLGRLLASVGPLALAVVGGGAFAKYISHARWPEIPVSLEDAARATVSQVHELVRYVQQSNPHMCGQLLDVLARDATTLAVMSTSIAALTINHLTSTGKKERDGGSRKQCPQWRSASVSE
jgi:hypothetical protein